MNSFRPELLWNTVLVYFLFSCCKQVPVKQYPLRSNDRFIQLTDSANMKKDSGDTALAIGYHKRALVHAQVHHLRQQQAESLLQIAKLLPQSDADTSLNYLDNALEIARSLNHYQLQADIYRSIAQIHKQRQNYTSALFALEAHHQLTDSLLNERSRNDLRQSEIRRKNVQKETIFLAITVGLIVIAITYALFYQKTRKLNRKLSQSASVRNKLFSIIGHDLRGSAGSIEQSLKLINSGAVDQDELPGFLDLIQGQSYILNETLDTLLEWSRSQLNEINYHPVNFVPTEMINNTIALLEGQLKEKDIQIERDVPNQLIVYADQNQLTFVVRNLLSNAIKFSHRGGVILLKLRRNKNWTEISVSDNGIGISVERQQLFRDENLETTFGTSGEKGSGLGLRMIKDFVAAAGGKISLTSNSVETCFCVSIPCHQN